MTRAAARVCALGLAGSLVAMAEDATAAAPPRPTPAMSARYRYANRPDALAPYRRATIYKDAFAVPPRLPGSRRMEPASVDTVRIGFIGPLEDADQPLLPPGVRPVVASPAKALFGRSLLHGAVLALEQANREGGHRGRPFELVRRTDLVQWGQTSNELARFAYEDGVWAVLSGLDSNHNHVLSRATLKAEVPIVNAGSSDPTLTEHAIPWLLRCMNDDRLNAAELLNYLVRVKHYRRLALLRVNDRDGRVGIRELVRGARRLGHPILLEQRFTNGQQDFRTPLERIVESKPDALVLWANPPEAAHIVRQIREMKLTIPVVGFDRMAHELFLREAGDAAEGVVVAASWNPEAPNRRSAPFAKAFRSRFGEEPDAFAAHAYDGMRLIIDAVRKAGLNRARIRDALFELRAYPGVTGAIEFDATQNDVSRPWLAEVRAGRFHYFRPPDWPRTARLEARVPSR